jgi:hypothetical protein
VVVVYGGVGILVSTRAMGGAPVWRLRRQLLFSALVRARRARTPGEAAEQKHRKQNGAQTPAAGGGEPGITNFHSTTLQEHKLRQQARARLVSHSDERGLPPV